MQTPESTIEALANRVAKLEAQSRRGLCLAASIALPSLARAQVPVFVVTPGDG